MTSSTRAAVTFVIAVAAIAGPQVPLAAQIFFPFPPYRNAAYDGSVRFDVTPKDAEVYVDGYYAGIVDDFDGVLQRLRVEPGQHEITLYHEGYRTARQRVYIARDRTFKMDVQMQPLAPGEAAEPRPTPAPASVPVRTEAPRPLPRNEAPERPSDAPTGAAQSATGQLVIRVQPADADVRIDAQPWPAVPGQNDVVVDVAEGRHVIQVRKAGYVGYLREVDVRGGETVTVEVTLRAQP